MKSLGFIELEQTPFYVKKHQIRGSLTKTFDWPEKFLYLAGFVCDDLSLVPEVVLVPNQDYWCGHLVHVAILKGFFIVQ